MCDTLNKSAIRYALPVILLIAILIRLGVLVAFPSVFAWDVTGTVHGSDLYDKLAVNLTQTGVYGQVPGVADAVVPPLYGYYVALIYRLFGRGWAWIAFSHIALDVLSILCLYHIGRRLMPRDQHPEAVALVACLCYACYPYLVFQNLTLIDTPLFMAILFVFVLMMVLLRERMDWRFVLSGGVALGLGILARPTIAPLGLIVAIWFLFRLSLRETIRRLAPVAIIGALLTVPWLVRNYGVYQTFVPMGNNSGMNFWFGNSRATLPFVRAGYHPQWATPDTPISLNDKIANGQYMDEALAYLRANPGKLPELLWVKFLALWSIDVYPSQNPGAGTQFIINENGQLSTEVSGLRAGDPVVAYSGTLFDQIGRPVHIIYFGGLLVLALIGVVITRRWWRDVSLLWFIQITTTILYVAFIPATRYRVPTDPLLFLFSACVIVRLGWAAGRGLANRLGQTYL